MKEVVAIRSKNYSFVGQKKGEIKKLKGGPKSTLKKDIKYHDFKNTVCVEKCMNDFTEKDYEKILDVLTFIY